jgi:hypothetical protein
MTAKARSSVRTLPAEYMRIPARQILVVSPTIHFRLGPGDRALVEVGDVVAAGAEIAERTVDAEFIDVGRIHRPQEGNGEVGRAARGAAAFSSGNPAASSSSGDAGGPSTGPAAASAVAAAGGVVDDWMPGSIWKERNAERGAAAGAAAPQPAPEPRIVPEVVQIAERRRPPEPGKWWVGGGDRRGRGPARRDGKRLGGTLLYEMDGRWTAAAGERHERVLAPTGGVVTEAANGVGVSIQAAGVAIPGAIAGGVSARGYLDVPKLVDGELQKTSLDVGKSGAIIVAGGRVSAEALTRARAMSIRGMVAGSLGQGELRDLAASEARQRAGLHEVAPFGVLALDGCQRRPIASPILALLAALAGREVAIITDPPMLVLDVLDVPLPELPPDWIRVRSGQHAGREGRWLGSAGLYRFRAGIHLEAAHVRLGDDLTPTVVALADLERFVF